MKNSEILVVWFGLHFPTQISNQPEICVPESTATPPKMSPVTLEDKKLTNTVLRVGAEDLVTMNLGSYHRNTAHHITSCAAYSGHF